MTAIRAAMTVDSLIHAASHKLNKKNWPIFFAFDVNSLLQRTLLKANRHR
jgi:hypothetical protein